MFVVAVVVVWGSLCVFACFFVLLLLVLAAGAGDAGAGDACVFTVNVKYLLKFEYYSLFYITTNNGNLVGVFCVCLCVCVFVCVTMSVCVCVFFLSF